MPSTLRIDMVAPPFAGHLFPLLDLAVGLRSRGFTDIRVLSTPSARQAVTLSGFELVEILNEHDDAINAIANTTGQVGRNPIALLRQFKQNLALMRTLKAELELLWQHRPRDLVIADMTVPVAGLTALAMGQHWWTGIPSPCAIETPTGTPSYLGGWLPAKGPMGHLRDACGRTATRLFKKAIGVMFRKTLRDVGLPSLYRAEGTEMIYSPERILAFGLQAFEFERRWPKSLTFVGPLTACPPFEHAAPTFTHGRPCVLISLGTHLRWARERAWQRALELARALPHVDFHFTDGSPENNIVTPCDNLIRHGYIPYDNYLHRYAAAVIHGGTGITYSCLRNAVPILVWPHDYDQFDHAARIVHHKLGQRVSRSGSNLVALVTDALSNSDSNDTLQQFATAIASTSAHEIVTDMLKVMMNSKSQTRIHGVGG